MSSELPQILVIDDSATIRASIKKFLGDGYNIHMAEDGEAGWEILQENENVSLVFADMHMPVLNGMLLLQRIRKSDSERIASVPVVMITGHDDTRAAKRAAHTIGASDFLSKPFTQEDLIRLAEQFTRLNRRIAEYNVDSKRNNLIHLENNRALVDFGNKSVAFSNEQNLDASIIYAEVAETKELIETHGSKITDQIIGKIEELLQNSLRKDELITRVDAGKFVIVLPITKAFKAHIVSTRLKKAARSIQFETAGGGESIRVNLAIGLTSTETCEHSEMLSFKDYCVQAALALKMSMESKSHPIVRYDETYEKQFEDLPEAIEMTQAEEIEGESSLEEFGEFFSGILVGEYGSIPQSYLPTLIEPIENFLEYARSQTGTKKSNVA